MPDMDSAVVAAVKGAFAGLALGSQRHGAPDHSRVKFYDPVPNTPLEVTELDAWCVWLDAIRQGVAPAQFGPHLAARLIPDQTETAFGFANVRAGLAAPICGSFGNPLSEGSAAIGRSIFWGLAYHGEPDKAAEYAYWDASIDHARDGVWIPVAFSYALASVAIGDDAKRFVDAFVYALPRQSKLRPVVPLIVRTVAETDGAKKLHGTLSETLGVADPLSAVLAGAWSVFGMVEGGGQFEPSMTSTTGFGGPAKQATMATAAACALLSGSVPDRWLDPIANKWEIGRRAKNTTLPDSLSALAESVASLAPTPIAPAEEAGAQTAPTPVAKPLTPISFDVAQESNYFAAPVPGCSVLAYYLGSPAFVPGETFNLSLGFVNTSGSVLDLAPILTPPPGWECAHRIGSFALFQGASTSFPVVLRCKNPDLMDQVLDVKIGKNEIKLPMLAPQRWYRVGPLLNQEGTGFDKEYAAQTNISLGAYFNGRSDMAVEWKESLEKSCQFDVESLMAGGPGTAYYFARVRFAAPGQYRVVVASGVGAILFLDGQKRHWYHDTHMPVPRPSMRYTHLFESGGQTDVLIKTFRNLTPVPPMTVYFLDATGAVVRPLELLPL